MKNLLYFFCIGLIFITCEEIKPKVPQFIISGQIENLNDSTIILSQGETEFVISVAADGSFLDTIYDFEDGYFTLNAASEYSDMYLKDGFDVFVNLNIVDFDESINYEGIGAAENNFLAKQTLFTQDVNFWDFCKFQEDTFVFKIDSFVASSIFMLENYAAVIPEFDPEFLNQEKANNKYLAAYVKEQYENVNNYFNKTEDFEVSPSFYNYRNDIALEDIKSLKVIYYPLYVEAYIANKTEETDTTEYAFKAIRTIDKELKDNELKKEFLYRSAKSNMPQVKQLEEYWALISFMVTDKPEYKELKKMYRSLTKIQKGSPSPMTSFKNTAGKEFSLNDFKGKYVYIDCWAQWCGPCKKETPFLTKLETKYADKDIVFLKLSLDKDKQAWKNYVEEKNLLQNSFIIENAFDSEFAKAFFINSIPRFILLDKSLNILDANALRPSNDELSDLLDNLLK